MQPDLSRDCLASLLAEESAALTELEALLEREHQVLAARDMAAIENSARIRQEKVGALMRIEEQRRSVCTLHGYSPDRVGLESLLQWCDPEGSLFPLLGECAQRALHCRDLNDRNAILVAARLQHVERRLAVLRGESSSLTVYGPRAVTRDSLSKKVLGAA